MTAPLAAIADLLQLPDAPATVELDAPTPEAAESLVAPDAPDVLASFPGLVDEPALARLRDRVWPARHFAAVFRADGAGGLERTGPGGRETLAAPPGLPACTVVWARDREGALGPDTTRRKFDAHAVGWNGQPGSPTYGHFRWMRRLVAQVARPQLGERALDAGCGAGWVGIEAGLMGAMVSAFDPSPEMVRIAIENAKACGIDLDARVGFVEDPPFDRPFDLVLNSGVISFAPDASVYLASLDRMVAPGGRLVIGDINPAGRGFLRRRRARSTLPARELNGLPRRRVAELLAERGYRVLDRRYYQLTFPVPELMALSETRLGGTGCGLMLAMNRAASALDHALGSPGAALFDSWIVSAGKPS